MATRQEAIAELQRRGVSVPAAPQGQPEKVAALEELARRGSKLEPDFLDKIDTTVGDLVPDWYKNYLRGVGIGLETVGRGVGLVDPQTPEEKERQKALIERSPAASIGELAGEATPFVAGGALATPAAGAAGAGALGIGALNVLIGTLEGGIISGGRGGSIDDILVGSGIGGGVAAGFEAVFPRIGKVFKAAKRLIGNSPASTLVKPDGTPTDALKAALKEEKTTFKQLDNEAKEFLRTSAAQTDPTQAARAARFESQGIPATRGDITQGFAQQAEEARLVGSAVQEAGEPLRQLRLEQSESFKGKVDELVDSLGVPSDTGDSLKAALSGRKKLLTDEKNALYKRVTDASPETQNIPIITDTIEDVIPDKKTSRRIGRLVSTQVEAVDDLLVEFGIDKSDEALEAFVKSGGEVSPLTLGNFEEFRQALNQIDRSDQTGAIKVITGPIKQALDEEAGLIDQAVSGIADVGIVSTLREARGRVRELKTEFSPQSITGRLIGVKRDGITPVIEASKVTNQLLRPTAPIEDLRNTLKSLSGAGKKGRKAIGDLQSSVILEALNAALKAPSRKTSGIETIGGNQFAKALDKFGDDKLKLLFKGNESALRRLKGLKQTALDITPTAGAVPKGSAAVILDIVNRAGRLPGLAAVVDVAKFVVKSGSDDRAVRKALNTRPELQKKVRDINRNFPEIAQRLGIVGILGDTENE